jgi:O-antigen/teichoic acid export membrane protein
VNALRMLGVRLGRHTAAYGVSGVIAFAFGIANLAVLTRFLSLQEFGELALLLLLAAALTILYNLPILQGGFSWVFGAGEEEVADDEDAGTGEKRRALGTALILTVLVGVAGTGMIVACSGLIGEILLGSGEHFDEVVLAGAAGALGSVWRLVSNVPRFERRPGAFIALAAVRPVLVLGVSIPLVAAGYGVEGALVGVAVGTLAAIVLALVATRRSYEFAFDGSHARAIVGRGWVYVPMLLSIWVAQNVDLYFVSLFAADDDVARYRVASRLGAGMSYFVSAFLVAWTPLTRTPLGAAAERERGSPEVTAAIATYFFVACMWLTVGLATLSDVVIKVAPASYAEAAPLIPLVALGFVAYGSYVVVYRGARIPRKRTVFVGLAMLAAVTFLVTGPLLVSWFGSYGAATAQLLAFALSTAILIGLSQRGEAPIPFDWGRMFGAAALAIALVAVAKLSAEALGEAGTIAGLVTIALFPLLAVVLGIVPAEHMSSLVRLLRREGRREAPGSSPWLVDGLRELNAPERALLDSAARSKATTKELAAKLNVGEEAAAERVVAALRRLGGFGWATRLDPQIGRYLLSRAAVAERDQQARSLWRSGADPFELEGLELLLGRIRRLNDRSWRSAGRSSNVAKRVARRAPLLDLAWRPDGTTEEQPAEEITHEPVQIRPDDQPGALDGEFVFRSEGKIPYILQRSERASALLAICFAGYRAPTAKPSFSYFGTLGHVDCHRLYVRSADLYTGRGGDFFADRTMRQLVTHAKELLGADRDRTITCGSSMGGSAAVGFGISDQAARHVIVGCPPLLYGDYLLGRPDPTGFRRGIAEMVAGGSGPEERAALNDLTLGTVREAAADVTIHLLYSKRDELYEHARALIEVGEAQPHVEILLTETDYARHGDLGHSFGPFMIDTLRRLQERSPASQPGELPDAHPA